ncbi:MAG: hypothetical protein IRY97_02855, partial [Thermomicrobiaceae bacterium]|nr:hypothetical protein [Thermomicrobiaceae bacterium]
MSYHEPESDVTRQAAPEPPPTPRMPIYRRPPRALDPWHPHRDTVVAVFDTRADAERAIRALHEAGFSAEQIGFAQRGASPPEGASPAPAPEATTEADEGAEAGALTGAMVGGIIGAAIVGLVPGVGTVLAAGGLIGI